MKPRTQLRNLLLVSTLATAGHAAAAPDAYSLLMAGHVGEATRLLHQAVAANPNDGRAHLLLCRAALAQEQADPAADECQRAAAALPNSSEVQDWLGRALGAKAAHANLFSAMGIAKRVHIAFERAFQLDPHNYTAASDLGEFYIAAPGIVGGGTDKAAALAQSILPAAPAKAHRLLALLAEKDKHLSVAESEYKAAVEAGQTPQAYSDLALFYQRNNRPNDALAAVQKALDLDRDHGPVQVDAASILTDSHRAPDLAIASLRAYLAGSHQTDESPVFKAHLQLGRLLLARGDKAGARAEFTAATTLAPAYEPAKKALAGL